MRESWHTNDEKIYVIPQNLSEAEVENHKQIAKKGTFTCPYCKAQLYVKSGEILGNFFSHLHGESCEASKQSEARYSKYEKQKKNDTKRQPHIVALMNDELNVLVKVYSHVKVTPGYLNPEFSKNIPDITLKIHDNKYAITVVTNITSSTDQAFAKSIQNQKTYYASLGYEPIFFIERNHLGIDIDGKSLVLWKTELQALTSQKADTHWQHFLMQLGELEVLQAVLKLPKTDLNVKSLMYITPANEAISIEAFHILEHPNTFPPKAHFFATPYKLSFSQAFKINDENLSLADLDIENNNQSKYLEYFSQAKIALERQLEEETHLTNLATEEKRNQVVENQQVYLKSYSQSKYAKSDKDKKRELVMKAFHSNN
ncbi:competence protein CoiA family protein [Paenisporosarcina indica]|uniref:competence protein CoiA family protein n=1 Tax=Paenisporosarcina indica TaxID=650093 RepID=UPI00094FEF2D|nr:competence protein CoiA family protein [Paenisporosarcina indica]